MNNSENNHHQINRIATPLRLDSAGRIIEPSKKEEPKKVPPKKKKVEITPFKIMISILLLILIALVAIIILIVIPEYKKSGNPDELYNDAKTTELRGRYFITEYNLSDQEYLTETKMFNINKDYNLFVSFNGINNTIIVNNEEVLVTEKVSSKVAIVQNVLLVITSEYGENSLRAINKDGKEIYSINSLDDSDFTITGFDFNLDEIVIKVTKVSEKEIIVRNQNIDVCDDAILKSYQVNLESSATAEYEIKYNGEEEFTKPKLKTGLSITDYKKQVC